MLLNLFLNVLLDKLVDRNRFSDKPDKIKVIRLSSIHKNVLKWQRKI